METALGAASWLFDKVVNKLSDDLVAGYVASKELGLNYQQIKTDLLTTQSLLHEAQRRDLSDNHGLLGLLQQLSKKADEAEDALDELHYFMIQDKLDGTREAVPDLGDGLSNDAHHVRHAVRHTAGNWLSYFSCCRTQDDTGVAADKNTNNSIAMVNSDSGSDGHGDKLPFDRVAMSNKIKSVIDAMHPLCDSIIKLLQLSLIGNPQQATGATMKRPLTSATPTQNKLYGRDDIFYRTLDGMTSGMYHETLSVLPIVGPGGIGKTTFTQHLFNHERTKEHFPVRIWICVSANFEVRKLTQEILSCILEAENEDSNRANNTSNLSLLHEHIKQRLKSKRFLIVFDDIWECKNKRDWDTLLAPFQKGETKGNMVLVTTRFPKIANMVIQAAHTIYLQGLEPDEFWKFFQACFGEFQDEHEKEELTDIARAIADRLKCSPLAAKTVGPLLRNKRTWKHWIGILENKEWQTLERNKDDIMPALQISYEYLPCHLKKCFAYFSLYPEDYEFDTLEITRFWIAIGLIDTDTGSRENYKAADLVKKYLEKLVDDGFLIHKDYGWSQYYLLHDLLHELSQIVSSQECVNVSSSSFRPEYNIPESVRHLSVTAKDGKFFHTFEEDIHKLRERIDIGNLRSLMIFGSYSSQRISNVLKTTFNEIKNLRVLFIFMNSPEDLPHNFSKLLHLRYLRIESSSNSVSLPRTISRFYHLNFLNLNGWRGSEVVPKEFNHLVNLRHLNASDEFHSNIPGVGKMEHLEELYLFHVKKQVLGFEIAELGKLTKLRGVLSICNLEKLRTKEEAEEAKLKNKSTLSKLTLEFDRTVLTTGHDVIEGLEPHHNLRHLKIVNHSGATGPSWLCRNMCVTALEDLSLSGISWDILPPFGQLPFLRVLLLSKVSELRQLRLDSWGVRHGSFKNLRTIKFYDMPDLVEWVGSDNNSHLFSCLENIGCKDCPNLTMLPFSNSNRQATHITWFPNLRTLDIINCPNISQLSPIPYTSTLTYVMLRDTGHWKLLFHERSLIIDRYSGALAFHNLGKLETMTIRNASHVIATDFQKLSSLRELDVSGDMLCAELGDSVVLSSVQKLSLSEFHATKRLLSTVFKCFPCLYELEMRDSNEGHGELVVLQIPSSSVLCKLKLYDCNNLVLSIEDGGGFRNLRSLHSLSINFCGNIFSQMEKASPNIKPFPASLRELELMRCPFQIIPSMGLLSNLTSLTRLSLKVCGNVTMDGFNPLLVLNLKSLCISNCDSLAADLLSEVVASARTGPAGFCALEDIKVDGIAAVLVEPVCTHHSATLRTLSFSFDRTFERFTEVQEAALGLLTSLEELEFQSCRSLRSFPETLHRLCSLKKLSIYGCKKIQSLPMSGLPSSLEFLEATIGCSDELRTVLVELRESHPDLKIRI